MTADDWTMVTMDDFTDPPTTVAGPEGPITISGAVFTEATDELRDLYREADTHRNLYPDEDTRGDL